MNNTEMIVSFRVANVIKQLLLGVSICFLLGGCDRAFVTRAFAYKDINEAHPWGIFHVRLLGKEYKLGKGLVEIASPYQLLIAFVFNKDAGLSNSPACEMTLEAVRVTSPVTNQAVFVSKGVVSRPVSSTFYKGDKEAMFSFRAMALDYADYIVDADLNVPENCFDRPPSQDIRKIHVTVPITKEYTETHRSFLEVLMSL